VPLALARLEEDPLIEGDFYPGDLLVSLVDLDESFWRQRPKQYRRAREVAERALEVLRERSERGDDDLVYPRLIESIRESIRTFLAK